MQPYLAQCSEAQGQGRYRGIVGKLEQYDDKWDAKTRMAVALALRQFGDARAVEPLIVALKDHKAGAREAAARALVTIYQSAQLDPALRQRILAQRGAITEPYINKHYDYYSRCQGHTDYHEDKGIGVDFPL